ncbi:MAG TPA: pyridoxine 5'-phosphate synthase [Chitinophagales bacterium]|jgi:pyridoxine 5-phosphate synthase|nr:pyridoxine 5'-phosphate synthase [Chitinophagales bacterium]
MTRLSVNLNKIALIRNARGSNYPDLIQVAKDCERFGAQGITVHPRPDERHCKFSDLQLLKENCHTEFNIEGFPDRHFLDAIINVKPHQCTLVPDAPGQITSDHGWNTIAQKDFLKEVIAELKSKDIRVSLFIDADAAMIEGAANIGADRIEYYTGPYAKNYAANPERAIKEIKETCEIAIAAGLGINAGHDLNLENLKYLKDTLPQLDEVSIGHALICDAIYLGLENTIRLYLNRLA